jgi:hypothetical protein
MRCFVQFGMLDAEGRAFLRFDMLEGPDKLVREGRKPLPYFVNSLEASTEASLPSIQLGDRQ